MVGVDLSDVSEHLLAQTRALIRPIDDAEVHAVHVVCPAPLRTRLNQPMQQDDIGARSQIQHVEDAKWKLERLCDALAPGPGTRVLVHTPVGNVADEVTRIALEVHADMIVLEAHARDAHGLLHRSVVARIARTAPCTVLAIRKPPLPAAPRSRSPLGTNWASANAEW